MKRYDIQCPICGTLNRGLDLEETDGWMECEKCGSTTQRRINTRSMVMIPVFRSYEDYLKSQMADHQAAG